jgi:hypothetical protein
MTSRSSFAGRDSRTLAQAASPACDDSFVAEQLVDTTDSKYQVGERWSYRTRSGEERSSITVLKVESSPTLGVIVHVSVDGLRMQNAHSSGPERGDWAHSYGRARR